MRWSTAVKDLEDPEIAAVTDSEGEHLERAIPLRHGGAASSSSSTRQTLPRAADGASSSPRFPAQPGRHGLLPPSSWALEGCRRNPGGTGSISLSSGGGDERASRLHHQQRDHQMSSPLSSSTAAGAAAAVVGRGDEEEDEDEEEGAETEDALESAKLLLAGGVAGAVSKTATAPLARLTILYQVQGMTPAAPAASAASASPAAALSGAGKAAARSTSTPYPANSTVSPIAGLPLRAALRTVIEREGVASLWRGNLVTVLHRLPYSAVNFWAYERLSEAWIAAEVAGRREGSGGGLGEGDGGGEGAAPPSPMSSPSDTARRLACGGAAGMAACTLAYPLDLVRTRLAASSGPTFATSGSSESSSSGGSHRHLLRRRPSVYGTLADVVRADGPRGLYRGLGATLAQVGPSLALNYTAYGALRAKWMAGKPPGEPPTIMMSLVCGAAAGLISSTATFPLDLVRRRMQLAGGGAASATAASSSSVAPNPIKPPRPTYAGVVRDVLTRAGPAGFYAGIMPEYYKVAPGVAIGFCTYEACRELLGVSPSLAFR